MSDQDLPTYLRGHSLSQADQASAQGAALLELCRAATADGRFSPEELAALRQWLAEADFAAMPAARYLRSIVEKVLADGKITGRSIGRSSRSSPSTPASRRWPRASRPRRRMPRPRGPPAARTVPARPAGRGPRRRGSG
jgi:hypothetical protein